MTQDNLEIHPAGGTSWSQSAGEVLLSLGSDSRTGLTRQQAEERLGRFGPNRLAKERRGTVWGIFQEEVREPMILLLLIVGVVYGAWGEARDAITIFVVIGLLVLSEMLTEYRAKKAVAALKKLSPPSVAVLRDGASVGIAADQVVPGDILVLEVGTRVPADARVIESYGLEADESPLTGESLPVGKDEKALPVETVLADRTNMVFAGNAITRGRGTAVVTATGMASELGKITGMVLEAKEPKTPLQLAMRQLARLLVWVAAAFSIAIPAIGIAQGKPLKDMVLTGLSLSFATIPEELPIVVTMVLGLGALELSRRHILIKRLRAAETLGNVTVIVTDKTGTITLNRATLSRIVTGAGPRPFERDRVGPEDAALLKIGLLTSSVKTTPDGEHLGDPLETALFRAAREAGIYADTAGLRAWKEFSFDNERKLMSVVYRTESGYRVYAKGAPEALLSRCSHVWHNGRNEKKTSQDEVRIIGQVEELAGDAMRVIAFACKETGQPIMTQEEAEKDLTFAGLTGFSDPPRPSVAEAIKSVSGAGIRVLVVSGDHPLTVERTAAKVGIPDHGRLVTGAELAGMTEEELGQTVRSATLFARTSAGQKLQIVSALHSKGEVVAVTGDGTNDAPALKSADIGIAVGETSTEVAREAADMVLMDGSFQSIASGVREGRKIFDNLKKGITYYLSVKVALVLSFVVALAMGLPFPFAPIQIILLELFMDLAASATFVAEPIEKDAMRRPPRRLQESFVDRAMLKRIGAGSLGLAAAVAVNYATAWYAGWGTTSAQTLAFATWMAGHIYLAFAMRSERQPIWTIGFFTNRVMLAWAAAAMLFLVIVTAVPQAQPAVHVTAMDWRGWAMALGVPFLTVFWMELRKLAYSRA